MLIEEYIQKLKQTYNYNEELINALLKIIPNMINYYGQEYENIILEAISNCPIYICNNQENIFDIINNFLFLFFWIVKIYFYYFIFNI